MSSRSRLVRGACRANDAIANGEQYAHVALRVGISERYVRMWVRRFLAQGISGLYDKPRPGRPPTFSPVVALHVVKMACERPDEQGRSLCQWDGAELAREMVATGVVADISRETVWRILASHQLKPWRHHLWLSSKVPRDGAFAQQIKDWKARSVTGPSTTVPVSGAGRSSTTTAHAWRAVARSMAWSVEG